MKSKLKKATSSYGLDKKDSKHGLEHTFCWNTSLWGFVYTCEETSFENGVKDIYFVKLLFYGLIYILCGNENIFECQNWIASTQ